MGEKKKEAAGRISLFLETWFLTMGALKMGFALTKDNKIVIQDSQTGRRADMDKYYNAGKKQSLKNEIGYYIDEIVDTAENMNSLDYFNIEISNHQGKLNVEYKLKNRKKVY